jgi:hypothetical protein
MPKELVSSRRRFLRRSAIAAGCTAFSEFFPSLASAKSSGVVAGAIRWDAWYKQADISLSAQDSLSSERYFRRAPFFCSVNPTKQVHCQGTAEGMAAEIHAAVRGGLKYWAFDWYNADSSLRSGWTLYNQNPFRDLINWCGIVELANLGSVPFHNNKWLANMKEWAEYMRQPNYQKVGAQRPLLYLFWNQNQLKWYFDNNPDKVRQCIDFLRQLLAKFSVGAPYIVLLDGTDGAPILREIGADAISNYISQHRRETMGPYRDLDQQTQEYWKTLADTNLPIVPIAMVGWDTRARQEKPQSWSSASPDPNPIHYYELPTPSELASHLQAAVNFIHSNPVACPTKTLLIYSWNECDEGGGLIPTVGDRKGSYLTAIAPIIS